MVASSTLNEPVSVFFQLSKVDIERREVWGTATEETPDKMREIMDYASSKPQFEQWSAEAMQRSGGKSMGNIREMHNAVAAGRAIALEYDDLNKRISLGAYVSDDNSWKKVLDGTLTGFSIGGRAKRYPDPRNPSMRRYTAYPLEISLVDAPAHPAALFKLIKAEGLEELCKVGQAIVITTPGAMSENPATAEFNPNPNPIAPTVPIVGSGEQDRAIPGQVGHLSVDLIDESRASAPISSPLDSPMEKTQSAQELIAIVKALLPRMEELVKATTDTSASSTSSSGSADPEAKLKEIGSSYGIARRDGEPLTPPSGYPSSPDEYGDPANYAWPLDSSERCSSALSYFNGGQGMSKYTPKEWNVLGRRISDCASKSLGATYSYSPADKQISSSSTSSSDTTEKTDMSTTTTTPTSALSKVDAEKLAGQLAQIQNVAVDQLQKDPAAVKQMLAALVAAVDGATTTSPASMGAAPTAPMGSQEHADDTVLKNAPSTGMATQSSGAEAASTTLSSTPASTMKKEDDMASTPASSSNSSDSSTTTSSSTPDLADLMTKMLQGMELLTKAVAGGVAPATPLQKNNLPFGDLAAILAPPVTEELHPVLKVLLSGDKDALAKAAVLAGGGGRPDVNAVYELARQRALAEGQAPFTNLALQRGYLNAAAAGLPSFFTPPTS